MLTVDGYHIQLLYLTLFYSYLRPLIEQGYLYIAKPPLYKISKGQIIKYAYSDEEKNSFVAELGDKCEIQRYKGLGEMNAEQLWDTTMNPEHRTLIQVKIEDAEKAEEILQIAMGKDVVPRCAFIEQNAEYINLEEI